eukprot:765104-Hanusia_phi.AAC.8
MIHIFRARVLSSGVEHPASCVTSNRISTSKPLPSWRGARGWDSESPSRLPRSRHPRRQSVLTLPARLVEDQHGSSSRLHCDQLRVILGDADAVYDMQRLLLVAGHEGRMPAIELIGEVPASRRQPRSRSEDRIAHRRNVRTELSAPLLTSHTSLQGCQRRSLCCSRLPVAMVAIQGGHGEGVVSVKAEGLGPCHSKGFPLASLT